MHSIVQDVRYAVRRLRAAPGFTLAVLLTLAAAIGGASATFSVLDATALQPLPFPDPDRLVRLRQMTPQGEPFSISEPDYLDYACRPSGPGARPHARVRRATRRIEKSRRLRPRRSQRLFRSS